MVLRNVPFKNYVKYGIIVFFTLLICIITFVIYNNHKNYENDLPILRNKVSEINIDDVDNYIEENEKVLLYFGVVHDENSESIEKEMIKMIDKYHIDFVYVNITDVKNKKDYFESFNKKYSKGKKIENYPAFIYIKDKEIVDIVQREDRYLEIEEVSNFIDNNEIKGEKDA